MKIEKGDLHRYSRQDGWFRSPIPISVLRLLLLILVKSAWAQGRTQRHLVLRETFNNNGRDALVGAVIRSRILDVFVRERGHGLQGLFHRRLAFLLGHVGILGGEQAQFIRFAAPPSRDRNVAARCCRRRRRERTGCYRPE